MTQAPSIKEALELKPCPFCGGPAGCVAFEFVTCLSAQPLGEEICPGKQIKAPVDRDEPTYSTAWNTRATLPPDGVRREAIARIIDPREDEAGIRDVAIERQRQKAAEGWTAEHDDSHSDNTLASAAAAYVFADQCGVAHTVDGEEYLVEGRELWPWGLDWWKPKDRRRNLVRAAALIIAEIERLDRAAIRSARNGGAET